MREKLAFWLILAGLILLSIPLYFSSRVIGNRVSSLEDELTGVEETIKGLETPDAEVQKLQDTLSELQQSMEEIEQVDVKLSSQHADWPIIMAAVGDYAPSNLTVHSLVQEDRRIKLQGRAANEDIVVAYAHRLNACPEFSRVVVQSIKAVEDAFATPTQAPPTPTPVDPSPEPTATPRLADQYEPDDLEPRAIYAYKPQVHNFYPIYDIDRLKFLVKSGRHYRLHTSKLAAGVDTVLTVKVGDQIYQNDDRAIGDFGSEVQFQVETGHDLEAFIDVTNRGKYGPDQTYEIRVEEIAPPAPTATATASGTVEPTQTPEPSETSTPWPEATNTPTLRLPTPTFDLRDEYEPDDHAPKPIAVGEEQAHNFCPDGDMDQVIFFGRGGGIYHVYTSRLQPGVDTVLTVRIGETTTHVNDDRAPGDVSSSLTFDVAGLDSQEVVAEIRNKGAYGASRWYRLKVEEVAPTSTPSVTSSPLPTHTVAPSMTASMTETSGPLPSPTSTQTPLIPTNTNTPTPSATSASSESPSPPITNSSTPAPALTPSPTAAEAHSLKVPGLASFKQVSFRGSSGQGSVRKAGRQVFQGAQQGSVEFVILLELEGE